MYFPNAIGNTTQSRERIGAITALLASGVKRGFRHVQRMLYPLDLVPNMFSCDGGGSCWQWRFPSGRPVGRAVVRTGDHNYLVRSPPGERWACRVVVQGCQLERSAAVTIGVYVAHPYVIVELAWTVCVVCCLLVGPLDRHGRTALELAALNGSP